MRKNGQEEMVGFVIIVVIVAIIGVILLGITLRKPQGDVIKESDFADNFLSSAMSITTGCETGFSGNYRNIRELTSACNIGNECLNGRKSCEVLEEEFKEIMGASWQVGLESAFKGYKLDISLGRGEQIIIENGNKTSNSVSSVESLPDNNKIILKIYF
jgi:hypothetical protein